MEHEFISETENENEELEEVTEYVQKRINPWEASISNLNRINFGLSEPIKV